MVALSVAGSAHTRTAAMDVIPGIEVIMDEMDRRRDGSGEYLAYRITTHAKEGNALGFSPLRYNVWRRYSEFDLLRQFLAFTHPGTIVPPVPEKKVNFKLSSMTIDRFDPEFTQKRREALLKFLKRVLRHPVLRKDAAVATFLQDQNRTNMRVIIDGKSVTWTPSSVEDRMKAMTASFRLKSPDLKFQELGAYADALQAHLTTFATVHARAERRYTEIMKSLKTLAATLRAMKENEFSLGSEFAIVADSFESSIDLTLKRMAGEAETFATPIQEYIDFAAAIKVMAKRQEVVQFEYEKAQAAFEAKEAAFESMRQGEADKGIKGFFSSFTGPSSEEERQAKLSQLQSQLSQLKSELDEAQTTLREFNETSTADIAYFHENKLVDFRDLFSSYCRLEAEWCECHATLWQRIKDVMAPTE
eukprot:m.289380 g.289380  ORF g.289380 m.289380 type:complete len:418 (-) comp12125_c0_seq1:22-1275(-)